MPTDPDNPPDVEVLFAGLPKTGKTTYLALLYLAISGGRATELALGGYSDDREYANRIAKKLLACEEITHTEVAGQGRLRLSLEVGAEHKPALLQIPDLSGETWEDAVYERTWSPSLDNAARAASGTALFVHVTGFEAAPSIADAQAAARALGEDDASNDTGIANTSAVDEGPRKRQQPTQVQIVDLLQLLCDERSVRPARTAIVLSAWDLTDQTLTPSEWLATNAPLADQYLKANDSWLRSSVWGVSAQGGSFRDDQKRAALLEQDAIDRARVLNGKGEPCAIETPTLWVIGSGAP